MSAQTCDGSTPGLHACCGLNECKGQGANNSGTMPGDGSCATVSHLCSGLNSCAGQGGCGNGSYEQQSCPGANSAAQNGGCGTPIGYPNGNAGPSGPPDCEYANSDGPNKGSTVWSFARRIFEQRMKAQGKEFGSSPCCGS